MLVVYISLGRVRESDLTIEPEGSLLVSVTNIVDEALVQFYQTGLGG